MNFRWEYRKEQQQITIAHIETRESFDHPLKDYLRKHGTKDPGRGKREFDQLYFIKNRLWIEKNHVHDVHGFMTPTGFEPVLPPWKGGVLTAWPRGQMAEKEGFEPSRRLPDLHP